MIPELAGRFHGSALRVPTPTVSLADFTALVERPPQWSAEVNDVLRAAATGPMRNVLALVDVPLVSVDFIGDPHSSIVDAPATMVQGELVKTVLWYDNEWAYACRVADMAFYMSQRALGRAHEDVRAEMNERRPTAELAEEVAGMTARVAIHGFGRTGPAGVQGHLAATTATGWRWRPSASSDLDEAAAAAHLLKYDSNYGRFASSVRVRRQRAPRGRRAHPAGGRRHPGRTALAAPWASTSSSRPPASSWMGARPPGTSRPVPTRSSSPRPREDADFTLIYGVNEEDYDPARHDIVSTSSDTGNALAAVAKVLDESFEVRSAHDDGRARLHQRPRS